MGAQGFTAADAWARLGEFLGVFRMVLPNSAVLDRARSLHLDHSTSFWDAMILAACIEAGVDILYSEDVPGLGTAREIRVINPFE
ncbi:MAG: PIN domain-containing protein [Acidobacteria bacterium]|nr:PIN domain-containing protein [Acidobacteriota bacterium]